MGKISENRILLFMFCLFTIVSIGMSVPAFADFSSYPSGASCSSPITDLIPLGQQVTIDGAITSGTEWGSVSGCNITFQGLVYNSDAFGGSPANPISGRLLFRHDAVNLYILLILEFTYIDFDPDYVDIHFYDAAGTTPIDGLQWWYSDGTGELVDQYNSGASEFPWDIDPDNGNNGDNVSGAVGGYENNGRYYKVFEFRKNLNSGDGYDFNLSILPATIKFDISFGYYEQISESVYNYYGYSYPDKSVIDLVQLDIGGTAPVVTPPTVTTMPATHITTTGATFEGTINPNGYPTTYFFVYGETSSYGQQTQTYNYENYGTPPGKVTLPVIINPFIDTTYHYRIVASNTTDVFSRGDDQTFTIYLTDSDDDGIADAYDNCRYDPNTDQAPIPGLCGGNYISEISQIGNCVPGESCWVQTVITNNTGQDIQTIKPDCYNTYWVIQGAKPLCRRGPAYGIPRDLITILKGDSYLVKCDINEMFESIPTGSPQISAFYENYIVDPDYLKHPNDCTVDNDCYVIWTGTVASTIETNINIGTSTINRVTADVSFNPDQWEASWATGNSPPITARINISGFDFTGITGTDIETILLNGSKVPIIFYEVIDSSLYIQFDRAKAVQSLGSIQPGLHVAATIQGKINDVFFSGTQNIVIVENTGTLFVKAVLHTIGIGPKPGSIKEPIVGMTVRLYDKSEDSCAAGYGVSWQNYPDIYNNCGPVSNTFTYNEGMARFNPLSGNYLVIGKYKTETGDIYIGNSVGEISTGVEKSKYLQVIKKFDGKKVPAKYSVFTGSELLSYRAGVCGVERGGGALSVCV